jgi:SAM-dependent methyltransferase
MRSNIGDQLVRVALVLAPLGDVIAGRVIEPLAPVWATARGWAPWLSTLDDAAVALAERHGLMALDLVDAPASLRELCDHVRDVVAPFHAGVRELDAIETTGVPWRKRTQVAALVAQCRVHPGALRIVDFGAGHGHLARALARELGVEVVGVDRDAARVLRARGMEAPVLARFVVGDAEAIPLSQSDLLVGLHACGTLGDAIVERAAASMCSLLLVSCCLQKIVGDARAPLSETGQRAGLTIARPTLGISNLAWGKDAARALGGRSTRHALRLLLQSRGVVVAPGAEAHGINKKRFRHDLGAVAAPALERRGLDPVTTGELRHFAAEGRRQYAIIRRYSLPRNMLGRVMELAVVLDRGSFLEERGHRVRVGPFFDVSVSPRNIGLVAHR